MRAGVVGGSGPRLAASDGTGTASDPEIAYSADPNSTGNTTLTPSAGVRLHFSKAVITGTASTRVFILATTDREAGDRIEIDFVLPDTASIVLEIRNATSGGTLLYTVTTDGSDATNGYHFRAAMRFNGTAWEQAGAIYPSI